MVIVSTLISRKKKIVAHFTYTRWEMKLKQNIITLSFCILMARSIKNLKHLLLDHVDFNSFFFCLLGFWAFINTYLDFSVMYLFSRFWMNIKPVHIILTITAEHVEHSSSCPVSAWAWLPLKYFENYHDLGCQYF